MEMKMYILLSFFNAVIFAIKLTSAEKEPVEVDVIKTVASSDISKIVIDGPVVPSEATVGVFLHAFVASLSVIIFTEIGDKTFFIAAIMAMKHSRLTVFLGAISALVLMTVLSVLFGWLATIIPRYIVYYASTALFAIFGIKMLWEGIHMPPGIAQEEMEEVHADLRKRDDQATENEKDQLEPTGATDIKATIQDADDTVDTQKIEKEVHMLAVDPESGRHRRHNIVKVVSRIFLQAFTLTFLAEWGDRSQLATIILSARENIYGVMLGGIVGHSLCTGLAVLGGRFVAQRISVRTVTIIGGVVFLIFALSALFFNPNGDDEKHMAHNSSDVS